MRTILALLLMTVLFIPAVTGSAPRQNSNFTPVATAKQLMEAIIIPASDTIFGAAGEPPKSDEEWTAVKNSAITVAESGNLLMIGSRAPDNKAWMKESKALTAAAVATIKAVDAKDFDKLMDASNQLYEVCASCHKQYLKQ
jgi:hypothetical protein